MLMMKFNWRSLSALCAAGFAVLTLAADTSIGQIDFDGGGSDSSWNTAENWVGDVVPTNAQTGRLDSGDSVVVDSNVNVGEVDSTDASLDLASGIFDVTGTLDLDSTGVTRSGGSFTAGTLIVSGTTQMTYEGADSTSRLQAIDGGELTIMKNVAVFDGQVATGGTLAVAAIFDAQTFTDVFEVTSSGVLSLETGGTFEGELLIDGGILERNGGLFDISMLDVNNSAVIFTAGDQIEDLMLSSSATAQVVQADGEFEGLVFTGTDIETELLGAGNLEVVFDDILLANQLDVGLQVAGDQQTELQALIDSGRITFSGGAAPAQVIFDGTNTVLGIVAVPEPGTGIVLIALGLCGLTRRSRNRN